MPWIRQTGFLAGCCAGAANPSISLKSFDCSGSVVTGTKLVKLFASDAALHVTASNGPSRTEQATPPPQGEDAFERLGEAAFVWADKDRSEADNTVRGNSDFR